MCQFSPAEESNECARGEWLWEPVLSGVAVALHWLHSTADGGSAGGQLPQLQRGVPLHGRGEQHSQVCHFESAADPAGSVPYQYPSGAGELSVYSVLLVVSLLGGGTPCCTPCDPLHTKGSLAWEYRVGWYGSIGSLVWEYGGMGV